MISYEGMDIFLILFLLIIGVSLLLLLSGIFLFKSSIGLLECIDNFKCHHRQDKLKVEGHSTGPLGDGRIQDFQGMD